MKVYVAVSGKTGRLEGIYSNCKAAKTAMARKYPEIDGWMQWADYCEGMALFGERDIVSIRQTKLFYRIYKVTNS